MLFDVIPNFNTNFLENIFLLKGNGIKVARQLNKKIIPIMIRKVDWTSTYEARYNAPLKAHPISLNKAKLEEKKVVSSTVEERDAYWEEIINEFRKKFRDN